MGVFLQLIVSVSMSYLSILGMTIRKIELSQLINRLERINRNSLVMSLQISVRNFRQDQYPSDDGKMFWFESVSNKLSMMTNATSYPLDHRCFQSIWEYCIKNINEKSWMEQQLKPICKKKKTKNKIPQGWKVAKVSYQTHKIQTISHMEPR